MASSCGTLRSPASIQTASASPSLDQLQTGRLYLPVSLVVLFGCLLSATSFKIVQTIERDRAEARFERAASSQLFAVRRRIHDDVEAVEALADFVASSDASHVDRGAFSAFATESIARNDSIKALEWIPRVPAAALAEYQLVPRGAGLPGVQVTEREAQGTMVPVAARADYFPVDIVVPYVGNEIALGFDLGSSPTRRAALEAARDGGEMTVSGRITLVQEQGAQAGFLAFVPVFESAHPHDSVEQRRGALRGFALGVYRIGDIVEGSIKPDGTDARTQSPNIDLYLFDLDGDPEARSLHVHSAQPQDDDTPTYDEHEARSGLHLAETVDIAGRQWLVVARPAAADLGQQNAWQPWVAALNFLAFTILLASHLIASLNRERAVEAQVTQRTLELRTLNSRLRDSEARASAVVDNIVDGIITVGEQGSVQSFNPAAERIFGYASVEVIGQNVKIIMPEPDRSAHDSHMARYLETGDARVIGFSREVQGRRKDGSLFPMELAISESHLGETRVFTGIIRDITERKEVDRMKNEFVSTVSHELRTPLTSILGSLGLVRSNILGPLPEKAKDLIDIAHNNSERLVRLINDILDIEKIESGGLDDAEEVVDIMELVEAALDDNTGLSEQFDVAFAIGRRIDGGQVRANRDRLLQVLANLLSNAVKFSPAGGSVRVHVSLIDGDICVSVRDRGPGIPEGFQHRIFQKFAQADASDDRQKGGTGLGLSISKAIVERYSGTIGFETVAGLGTTFHFTLPAVAPDEARVGGPLEGANLDRRRVLVCEDDPDVAQLLALLLEDEGFDCDIAYCASEAKELLNQRDYAALTLDLVLPDQDGIELIRELRASPETRWLPIIVVSLDAERGARELNGDAIGVIDWMGKPIDQTRLSANLKLALRARPDARPRILHVEDNADVVKIVGLLVGEDADTVVARDLHQAKSLLEREAFDLVLLDLILPDGSGEELLPLLNKPNLPPVPVIIFSAKDANPATSQRVSAALVKATTSNELLAATIRSHIGTPPLPDATPAPPPTPPQPE
jgi:PAS domain S-box-containing protein